MATDGKFHWALKFVRMTTKSVFNKFKIKLVLLNRFRRNKVVMKAN